MAPSAPASDDTDTLREFLRDLDLAWKPHEARIVKFKRWDRVYKGILERLDDNWRSALHPPYAWQIIETYLANIIDGMPVVKITPSYPGLEKSASALQAVRRAQRRMDHFSEKQPNWVAQGLVRGISPAKVVWDYCQSTATRWVFEPQQYGAPIRTQDNSPRTIRNQPSFLPWDAIDFCWDPAATSVDDWRYVFARTWDTLPSLQAMADKGVYRNVDQLQKSDTGKTASQNDRDTKGRVEVWEQWTRDRVIVVANRKTVLRDDPNPFWHGEIPFVVATPFPMPFRIDGTSLCEIIEDQQRALWDLQNQRIDNARLINNSKKYYNATMFSDVTQLEDAFPGAVIAVEGPPSQAVFFEQPNISILEAATQAESMIKQDIQDLTGAVSYISGANQDTVDQKTATGISMVTNAAQKRLLRVKQQYGYALTRGEYQASKLNQQLLSVPIVFQEGGPEAAGDWMTVRPDELQGEFQYEIEDLEESLNRQEQRSEALLKAQAFMQIAQFTPVNFDAVRDDIAEAYGEDPAKYKGQPAPPPVAVPPPGAPTGLGAPNGGAPQAPATPPPSDGTGQPANFANRASVGQG